jgi:hypothetical protein
MGLLACGEGRGARADEASARRVLEDGALRETRTPILTMFSAPVADKKRSVRQRIRNALLIQQDFGISAGGSRLPSCPSGARSLTTKPS